MSMRIWSSLPVSRMIVSADRLLQALANESGKEKPTGLKGLFLTLLQRNPRWRNILS